MKKIMTAAAIIVAVAINVLFACVIILNEAYLAFIVLLLYDFVWISGIKALSEVDEDE